MKLIGLEESAMKRKRKKLFRRCKTSRYIVAYVNGLPIMYKSNYADQVAERHGFMTPWVDKVFSTAGAALRYLQSCDPIIPDQDWDASDDCLWWDCYD